MNSLSSPYDDNGHGTMVASISAGTGAGSNGTYKGVAYMANIVAVKVLGSKGRGYASNIIAGLEWVMAKKMSTTLQLPT
ncbi:MAG: S8 family serine peptidase [Candidatus Bathycorpusculaceae bacterium]